VALDSHDTNGQNQSHTVCGAERALSITLALTLAFWDCGGHVWGFHFATDGCGLGGR
jgi:hypothetical protein